MIPCITVTAEPAPPSDLPTVLVLDDDALIRQAARRFLMKSGYGCIEADTAEDAVVLLRTRTVVAAMLDMRLPHGRTGLELLVDLRKIPELATIPVLIVTGSVLSQSEHTAVTKHRGFVFFKPEGFSTIVSFLDQMTGRDRSS